MYTALSRWRHGFESRWGCSTKVLVRCHKCLKSGPVPVRSLMSLSAGRAALPGRRPTHRRGLLVATGIDRQTAAPRRFHPYHPVRRADRRCGVRPDGRWERIIPPSPPQGNANSSASLPDNPCSPSNAPPAKGSALSNGATSVVRGVWSLSSPDGPGRQWMSRTRRWPVWAECGFAAGFVRASRTDPGLAGSDQVPTPSTTRWAGTTSPAGSTPPASNAA